MGVLRGYDVCNKFPDLAYIMLISTQVYLNIVLDEALEERPGGEKIRIGMVVIRGNAVVMLEVHILYSAINIENMLTPQKALDRINQDVPKIGR